MRFVTVPEIELIKRICFTLKDCRKYRNVRIIAHTKWGYLSAVPLGLRNAVNDKAIVHSKRGETLKDLQSLNRQWRKAGQYRLPKSRKQATKYFVKFRKIVVPTEAVKARRYLHKRNFVLRITLQFSIFITAGPCSDFQVNFPIPWFSSRGWEGRARCTCEKVENIKQTLVVKM
jgi:hypothetical protein